MRTIDIYSKKDIKEIVEKRVKIETRKLQRELDLLRNRIFDIEKIQEVLNEKSRKKV